MAKTNSEPKKKPTETQQQFALDPAMLRLLVCPLTKGQLEFDVDKCELISKSARLAYPIRGGIPILLPSEARALDEDEI